MYALKSWHLFVHCLIEKVNIFVYLACKLLCQGEKYVESKMPGSIIACNIADLHISLIYMKIAHEVLNDIKNYN